MKFKIATWNVGEDETKPSNMLDLNSYQKIVDKILEHDIDIICFQEGITDDKKIVRISKYIAEHTDLIHSSQYGYAESHINIGSMMGVITCAKYPIEHSEIVKFKNPKLIYKRSEGKMMYSHDKGFIITEINDLDLVIANGHGIPFYAFKEDALDFIETFQEMEYKLESKFKTKNNFLLLGDMNYEGIDKIFPNLYHESQNIIDEITHTRRSTKEDKQLDYILASKNIKHINTNVLATDFDHKLCIAEFEIKGDKVNA